MTQEQANLIKRYGKNPEHWDVIEDSKSAIIIVSKRSKRRFTLKKRKPRKSIKFDC